MNPEQLNYTAIYIQFRKLVGKRTRDERVKQNGNYEKLRVGNRSRGEKKERIELAGWLLSLMITR